MNARAKLREITVQDLLLFKNKRPLQIASLQQGENLSQLLRAFIVFSFPPYVLKQEVP